MAKIKDKSDNLCMYCADNYAVCNANPIFGYGVGNDNVTECDWFFDPVGIVELENELENE